MKTCIVTGASGNLGQAVVKKFLDEGFNVVGTVIENDPVPLNITNNNFKKQVLDLSNEKAVEDFINQQKKLEVAVLTVGGFAMGKIADSKLADIKKQLALNFETAYAVARPVFLKMMEAKEGRIFLIGSKPGLNSRYAKGMVGYSLAKSLIFRLAELMNDEAKGTNVVTSVIVPSTIDTPENRKSMPDADPKKWVKAEEIASAIYYYSTEGRVIREPVIKTYNNS